MSSRNDTPSRAIPEESRLQIAVVAGATERANRPRFLMVIAGLLLAGAAVYAGVQGSALASAHGQVQRQQDVAKRLGDLVVQVRAAHAQQQLDALPRDAETADKLERLARSVGLPSTLRINERGQSAGAPGFTKRSYTATFNAPDVAAVLDWLVQATGENTVGITGVELNSIRLRPQHTGRPGGWNVEVTLTRIERGS